MVKIKKKQISKQRDDIDSQIQSAQRFVWSIRQCWTIALQDWSRLILQRKMGKQVMQECLVRWVLHRLWLDTSQASMYRLPSIRLGNDRHYCRSSRNEENFQLELSMSLGKWLSVIIIPMQFSLLSIIFEWNTYGNASIY